MFPQEGSKILRAEEIGQIRPAIYIELKPGVVKKTRNFSITKSTNKTAKPQGTP